MNASTNPSARIGTHTTVRTQAAAEGPFLRARAGRSDDERSVAASDLRALLGELGAAERALLEASVRVDERAEPAGAAGAGPRPRRAASRAAGAATVALQRRLRHAVRRRHHGLRADVGELAVRLGTVVPREVGEDVVRGLFGELTRSERALVLWLAGDYRVQHGCIGRTGTVVFEQACRELADADGVLPVDAASALHRRGCRLDVVADVLERHPRLRRMGGRWVLQDGTATACAAAALAALARPATLQELREAVGRPRLSADAVRLDPSVAECAPHVFVRRARAAARPLAAICGARAVAAAA